MQVTALIDLNGHREHAGSDIPFQESDAEPWFAQSPADVEFAKALCGECPVRIECLAGALSREEPWGVWGGSNSMPGWRVARVRSAEIGGTRAATG